MTTSFVPPYIYTDLPREEVRPHPLCVWRCALSTQSLPLYGHRPWPFQICAHGLGDHPPRWQTCGSYRPSRCLTASTSQSHSMSPSRLSSEHVQSFASICVSQLGVGSLERQRQHSWSDRRLVRSLLVSRRQCRAHTREQSTPCSSTLTAYALIRPATLSLSPISQYLRFEQSTSKHGSLSIFSWLATWPICTTNAYHCCNQ